jgi:hypothetical protein
MLFVPGSALLFDCAGSLHLNGHGDRFTASKAQRGDAPV